MTNSRLESSFDSGLDPRAASHSSRTGPSSRSVIAADRDDTSVAAAIQTRWPSKWTCSSLVRERPIATGRTVDLGESVSNTGQWNVILPAAAGRHSHRSPERVLTITSVVSTDDGGLARPRDGAPNRSVTERRPLEPEHPSSALRRESARNAPAGNYCCSRTRPAAGRDRRWTDGEPSRFPHSSHRRRTATRRPTTTVTITYGSHGVEPQQQR